MSMMSFASSTRSGSASDLPMFRPTAIMKVLAMPPPTIRLSTLSARLFRMDSLVDTFEPATMASSGRAGWPARCPARRVRRPAAGRRRRRARIGDAVGGRFGAVRGAEGVVDVDVAQLGHFLGQLVVILLFALVDAAVFQQHDLAGATSTPSTQSCFSSTGWPSSSDRRAATGASVSSGLNSPSVGRPRCDVTITAAPASSACGWPAPKRGCGCLR